MVYKKGVVWCCVGGENMKLGEKRLLGRREKGVEGVGCSPPGAELPASGDFPIARQEMANEKTHPRVSLPEKPPEVSRIPQTGASQH